MNPKRRSLGTSLLIIFFAAGSLICFVTMLALGFPGSFLESIWRLKPEARVQFEEIGRGVSIVLMGSNRNSMRRSCSGTYASCRVGTMARDRNPHCKSHRRLGQCFASARSENPYRPSDRRTNGLVSCEEKSLSGKIVLRLRQRSGLESASRTSRCRR